MDRAERAAVAAMGLSFLTAIPGRAQEGVPVTDSLVLVRTACLGSCPVYRLSILRGGGVTIEYRKTGSEVQRDSGSALPGGWAHLLQEFERVRFGDLPEDTMQDRQLCPVAITDAPSAVLMVFRQSVVKRVRHYHGCGTGFDPWRVPPVLEALSSLAAAVDSVGQVDKWLAPRRGPPNGSW